MSTFSSYQTATGTTAIYPGAADPESIMGLSYAAMGLANEAGEVLGKVKKIIRDNDGVITAEHRENIAKELGDTLWYLAQVATQIDYPLSLIAQENLDKLADRAERGVLQGSGDNR
ncbi:MazG-like nucleotide pyrophosphohydrolase [Mycobacterium phage Skinny]|uniref:MazG-like nucleotide pyrophosphohydrolase n=6 Tax=Bongovirus bongo TaxID=1983750 RepID=A0A0M3UKL6_9CAUD|nr:MazG-like pyrophosphatase [Mycobacterium phage PegLeg]YP_009604954.1 MazG-like pyrophosphatase [Mycobacterium phage Bongo]ALF00625.1 MazG-like nucleotide pyrophosphohydrolase [Mycobacterium phage Bricole]AXQ52737.1 MazG-like nucleotide pyrophosphohydrolase [Mycobacterium phage IPhane7]QDH93673.1 MazG-like nucleotide pyrophosphohydrolase [Mycobacterium phage LilhomieP]QGJ93240.1 MazG-like nucleotide pyrophosphohydrolase [Mycobacterium phage TyDawg]QUU29302.1 nucleotide pyrophosphohydrolase 